MGIARAFAIVPATRRRRRTTANPPSDNSMNRKFALPVSAAAAALVAFLASSAGAQQGTTTASLRGVITTNDHAPVGAATVTATNEATGVRRGTQSDDAGRYLIPLLEPGVYTIRAQRIGLRPAEQKSLRLTLGQVA